MTPKDTTHTVPLPGAEASVKSHFNCIKSSAEGTTQSRSCDALGQFCGQAESAFAVQFRGPPESGRTQQSA